MIHTSALMRGKAHRNGYKDRSLKIWYGEAILQKPQSRKFPFKT